MDSSILPLVCPNCHIDLTLKDNQYYFCDKCNENWKINNGIPNFINIDTFWAESGISKEILQNIIKDMENQNWKEILEKHESYEVCKHSFFIANLERARWHTLLRLPKESIILDVGAGMGTISHALSKCYKAIYSVEPVKERTEFMNLRFKQENINNIKIIRTNIDNLPFPLESFDLIILNGILEWVPYSKRDINPRQAQLSYLKLLRKFLKTKGVLYVGIENRYYYGFFRGYNDPHISLKFVTVLPRMLAHVICKLKTGDIYRPYLYSYSGYTKLFTEAGFSETTIYSSLPSYNEPMNILELEKNSIEFYDLIMISEKKWIKIIKDILLKLDILKYLGYAYIIFAKK